MRRITVAAVLVACAACGEKLPLAPPKPASISIKPEAASMNVGVEIVLTVIVNDAAGTPMDIAKPPALTFASRLPSIVAVDSTGRVTAKSLGSTYVVAIYKSESRTLTDSAAMYVAMPVSPSQDATPSSFGRLGASRFVVNEGNAETPPTFIVVSRSRVHSRSRVSVRASAKRVVLVVVSGGDVEMLAR